MSESGDAGRAGGTPAPSPQLQCLGALVGRWRSEGHIVGGEYDPATDSITARADDNLGNITIMQARVDEQGVWRFIGGGDGASWQPWMDMTFTRMP